MRTPINDKLLKTLEKAGLIRVDHHPTLDLRLIKYTANAVYAIHSRDKISDFTGKLGLSVDEIRDFIIQCRGLVIDSNYNIVTNVVPKFFNYQDFKMDELVGKFLSVPYRVTEKADGSAILLFNYDAKWIFTTLGKFNQPQAQKAKNLFGAMYSYEMLDTNLTYMFECVYPENRIVVDYGMKDRLIFITAMDSDEKEYGWIHSRDSVVEHNFGLFGLIREMQMDGNNEGYVVQFEDGLRIKFKTDAYVKRHKLYGGQYKIDVILSMDSFAHLMSDTRVFLEGIVDHYHDGIRQVNTLVDRTMKEISSMDTRKEQALYIQSNIAQELWSVMFSALSKKENTNDLIHKVVSVNTQKII